MTQYYNLDEPKFIHLFWSNVIFMRLIAHSTKNCANPSTQHKGLGTASCCSPSSDSIVYDFFLDLDGNSKSKFGPQHFEFPQVSQVSSLEDIG